MNSLNAVFAKIANELPTLCPQKFVALDHDVFKVASLYGPLTRTLTYDEMRTMHAKALGDNFSLIDESVEFHSNVNGRNYITSIVHANTVSQAYDEKVIKASMRCISKNVFMDDEDHIWKVAGTGDNQTLVQSKQEDFAAILKERINSMQNVVVASCTTDDINVHDTENGDYVLYYSKACNDLSTGFAFKSRDKYVIYSYDKKEYEEVPEDAIVRAAYIDSKIKQSPFHASSTMGDDLEMTNGEFTKGLQSKYSDYMKFLYDGTDYFKKLNDLIHLRDQTGHASLPVSTIR